MRFDTLRILDAAQVHLDRKAMGQRHADSHTFTMHKTGRIVARCRFQRVTESMAEIEKRPVTGFALVARNNGCLATAGFSDGLRPCRAAGEDLLPVLFQPFEKIRAVDQAVFRNFGITGPEFTRAQRIENLRIGQNQLRLIKDTDEIFAMCRVDPGLATDRGIHLRQERGRHLHEIHTTPHDTGDEARKIANHTAAKCHDRVTALQPRRQYGIGDGFQRTEGFGLFTRRNNHRRHIDTGLGEACCQALQMSLGNIFVRHHRHAHAFQTLRQLLACTIHQPLADQNIVGAVAKRHGNSRNILGDGRRVHA